MENSSHNAKQIWLLGGRESNDIERILKIDHLQIVSYKKKRLCDRHLQGKPFLLVIHTIDFSATFVEIFVVPHSSFEK
jgi:hypothetical protein